MPSLDPTSALMSHSVCVYRRPDRYLFQAYVPHHTGHGSVPTDSILSAPLAVPCDVLGNTLLTALDSAALLPPPSGPSRQPPLFREAGVRGTRAFFRDTLVCFVDRSDTELAKGSDYRVSVFGLLKNLQVLDNLDVDGNEYEYSGDDDEEDDGDDDEEDDEEEEDDEDEGADDDEEDDDEEDDEEDDEDEDEDEEEETPATNKRRK